MSSVVMVGCGLLIAASLRYPLGSGVPTATLQALIRPQIVGCGYITTDPASCPHRLSTMKLPFTDLEYTDDVAIFAESSAEVQHVVNLVSKLDAVCGLRLRPDECKQIWVSSRPQTGIKVDGQSIKLVDEFCYLSCMLKNNTSYKKDIQQRCAETTSAINSLTKCLCSTPITNEVDLRVYLFAVYPIMMYGSET
ncbi:hypothetical protein RB195_003344 [Necator americanus]|uniref:Reverse transcriptase domain-containing protein n=1 Tax=Necator americanus TaxID=51031 RepID=A0ABR1DNQ7_NECAM